MKKTKLISLSLALIISLGMLSACKNQKNDESTKTTSVSVTESSKIAETTEEIHADGQVAVYNNSMSPVIPMGYIVYYEHIDPKELKEGDIIAFVIGDDTNAVHRITEIVVDENDPEIIRFRTKGDANPTEDYSLVNTDQLLGIAVEWHPDPVYNSITT